VQSENVRSQVENACAERIAPLVEGDGGELWVVVADSETIHLHLAGLCAGCPGASLTDRFLVRPALQPLAPKAVVRLTTGFVIPPGAVRIGPR